MQNFVHVSPLEHVLTHVRTTNKYYDIMCMHTLLYVRMYGCMDVWMHACVHVSV